MLALTPAAAEVVEALVSQPEAPDGAVLRISSEEGEPDSDGEETRDLELSVVDEPEPGDVRVQGIAMTVEPQTLEFLDDKVLDAEVSDQGVSFRLYMQPPEGIEETPGHTPGVDDPPSPNGSGPTAA